MADRLVQIAGTFWNIRGSFRMAGGLLDVGIQASLARLASGGFAPLDAYVPDDAVMDELMAITSGGSDIELILNLYPFHTIHVPDIARRFPHAKLYGTRRHAARAPEVAWQPLHTDDDALHEALSEDFERIRRTNAADPRERGLIPK